MNEIAFDTKVTDAKGNEFADVWVSGAADISARPVCISCCEWITQLSLDEAISTSRMLLDGSSQTDNTLCSIGGWFRYFDKVEASGLGLALMNAATVANLLLGSRAAA